MPPPEDFTKDYAVEHKEIIEKAESIIESLEPFSSKIDDDIAFLEDLERKIDELETTIVRSRAEIKVLKQQMAKGEQKIKRKLYLLLDLVRQHTEDETVISTCKRLLSLRFEQFPRKKSNIYKNTNNMEK